jgi:beta-lactamase class A
MARRLTLHWLGKTLASLGLALTVVATAQAAPAKPAAAKPLEANFDQVFVRAQRAPAPPANRPAIKPGAESGVAMVKPLPKPIAEAPAPLRRPNVTVYPVRLPPQPIQTGYLDPFQAQLAQLTNAEQGRIGVAAYDLSTGKALGVLGDQPFPMASTSKVAIAATYLDMVDSGRVKLSDQFPLMVPLASRKFDGEIAPVRPGMPVSARGLIEAALIRSDNQATDALLAAIGGPKAVNDWLRRVRIEEVRLDRDIATLVRDDGAFDPAKTIDPRDSATPRAMVRLLSGLYQGHYLSAESRAFLLATMARCETGKRRIPELMPEGLVIAHKTGTLSNTSSDIGIITMPDGRAIAMAIYVTGQGGKQNRDARIAGIARTIYDGYLHDAQSIRRTAVRR